MPCCGTTFCLTCITHVLQANNEAQIEQPGDTANAALCKKCTNCNQLVVISDNEHGLLDNAQVVKMIKAFHSPFKQDSMEAAA